MIAWWTDSQPCLSAVSDDSWLLLALLRNRIKLMNFRDLKSTPHRQSLGTPQNSEPGKVPKTVRQHAQYSEALGRKGGDRIR